MSGIISTLLSGAMILGPIVGYIDQYRIIEKKKSSAGFNSITCAVLLFANVLRVFFWLGKRFELTLLFQSIAMILAMLVLLEIVVRYQPNPITGALYSELRSSFSTDSIQDDLLAEENGIDIEQRYSLRRSLKKPFWRWDYYIDYIYCLLVFTGSMSILYFFFGRYSAFIEIIGVLSLGIESTLPLPQCISNFKNRSTKGFSILVLGSWFLGDGFKLFYFIYTRSPIQFIICGAIQLSIDTLIVLEFIAFSKFIQNRFSHVYWIQNMNQHMVHSSEEETEL